MSKNEEWNEFLSNLLSCSLKNLQTTKEYEYQKQRREHIDEMLTTNLTKDEKDKTSTYVYDDIKDNIEDLIENALANKAPR